MADEIQRVYCQPPDLRHSNVAARLRRVSRGCEGFGDDLSAAREPRRTTMRKNRPALWITVLLFAATWASVAQSGGRVLVASDVIVIRIVDHPELDTTTRVEPDGTINFPYVGRIKAAGRTEDDLGHVVRKRLVELKIIAGPLVRGGLGMASQVGRPSHCRGLIT
jgi:hypothetical protein